MQREAHFRKCIYRDERWWDEYLNALLEEEWFRAWGHAQPEEK